MSSVRQTAQTRGFPGTVPQGGHVQREPGGAGQFPGSGPAVDRRVSGCHSARLHLLGLPVVKIIRFALKGILHNCWLFVCTALPYNFSLIHIWWENVSSYVSHQWYLFFFLQGIMGNDIHPGLRVLDTEGRHYLNVYKLKIQYFMGKQVFYCKAA